MDPVETIPQPILNVAAYRFVPLRDVDSIRDSLLADAKRLGLKGTVLLSHEGVNLFVAGEESSARDFIERVKATCGLETLETKESLSDAIPFNRMLVKIKKEIIALGIDSIQPHVRTAPKLDPAELKQWLDQGRDLVLLDVRNDFEVEVGTFRDAVPAGITHFRDFEASLERLPPTAKEKPIVMFCTGGIRCEKAGPLMQQKGFDQVYQLDGGILKYFEDVGGDHFEGDCFVFDGRVAVDAKLQVSQLAQCFCCQAILTHQQQQSSQYVVGESCPRCYRSPAEKMIDQIAIRHRQLETMAKCLPGSKPHAQQRPIRIPSRLDGCRLIDCLIQMFPQIPEDQWQQTFDESRILDGNIPARAARRVRSGEQFIHVVNGFIEPDVNAAIKILHEDAAIVVVDKPAPLPVHPSGRFFHNTLVRMLSTVYRPEILRAVHRLDADTTGLVVLARRRSVAKSMGQQFEQRHVEKSYRVRCVGHFPIGTQACEIPIAIRHGEGRIRVGDPAGEASKTLFRDVEHLSDGTSLLYAVPVTGRTNQIRVHLWELGFPVCGDPIYLPGRKLGMHQSLGVGSQPLCLHANRLRFTHPTTGQTMELRAADPVWSSEGNLSSVTER
jgi:RluA family pseudouridine synthase